MNVVATPQRSLFEQATFHLRSIETLAGILSGCLLQLVDKLLGLLEDDVPFAQEQAIDSVVGVG